MTFLQISRNGRWLYMNISRRLCSLLLAFISLISQSYSQTPVEFTSSNLPIIVINTHGQPIPDEPKIAADMGIIYNGPGVRNNLNDPFNDYNGKIGIEVRGASSQMFPKKQFAVETRDENGADLDVSLLGFPEESDWVLSAPYSDKTMVRNVLTYKLSNDLGRYASRTRYCELVVNGDYRGVYVLMEKVKRDKNRVNITKLNPEDISGNDLTGGYIIKIDKVEGSDTQGWQSTFLPYPGAWQRIFYQYDEPDQDGIVAEQKTYIQNFIHDFETLMAGPNYTDPLTGYAQAIDVDSFVDFFIINEISRNVDGYRLSSYMHKDRDSKGGMLKMGPVWDFDLAFGNADYYNGSSLVGWQVDFRVGSDGFQIPFWWQKLVKDTSFAASIYPRWQALRQTTLATPRIQALIDSMAQELDEAQRRNFQRWPILGQYVWPNDFIGQTYSEEVNHLKEWIAFRILWIDARIPGNPTSVAEIANRFPADFVLAQNYPNPFNPTTTIPFYLPRSGQVALKIFDVSGSEVATLVERELPSGWHNIQFDAARFASGVYFYKLQAGSFLARKKFLLVK